MTIPGAAFGELLRSLVKKRATVLYPFEKVEVPDGFRGKIHVRDDLCIGCSRCSVVCPAQCIDMVMEKEKKVVVFSGKEIRREKHPKVNLLSCIRCGVCEESCPTKPKAISLTKDFSGSSTKADMYVEPTVP